MFSHSVPIDSAVLHINPFEFECAVDFSITLPISVRFDPHWGQFSSLCFGLFASYIFLFFVYFGSILYAFNLFVALKLRVVICWLPLWSFVFCSPLQNVGLAYRAFVFASFSLHPGIIWVLYFFALSLFWCKNCAVVVYCWWIEHWWTNKQNRWWTRRLCRRLRGMCWSMLQ